MLSMLRFATVSLRLNLALSIDTGSVRIVSAVMLPDSEQPGPSHITGSRPRSRSRTRSSSSARTVLAAGYIATPVPPLDVPVPLHSVGPAFGGIAPLCPTNHAPWRQGQVATVLATSTMNVLSAHPPPPPPPRPHQAAQLLSGMPGMLASLSAPAALLAPGSEPQCNT